MSLFDKLFKVRHKPFNDNEVMNILASFMIDGRNVPVYDWPHDNMVEESLPKFISENKCTRVFKNDIISIRLTCIKVYGLNTTDYLIKGYIYNNQYVVKIGFVRIYREMSVVNTPWEPEYYRILDNKCKPTHLSKHEKIDLPDATFNMFLSQHIVGQ